MRHLIAALQIIGFFGCLAAAHFFAFLAVQANFGILDVTPMDLPYGITSQGFSLYMFATLAVASLAIAWGLITTLDKRLGL